MKIKPPVFESRKAARFGQAIHDCLGLDCDKESDKPVLAHRASEISALWVGGVQDELTKIHARTWRAWLARKLL